MATAAAHQQQPWVPFDTFGNRLTLIRQHLGLSQVEAAERCGLDDGSWSNWERGAKPRGMDRVVQAIAAGLGVDRDWLMWGGELAKNKCALRALSYEGQSELPFPIERELVLA